MPRVAELINHLNSIAESITYRFWRDAFKGPEYLSAVESDLASMGNPADPKEANVFFNQHFDAVPLKTTGHELLKRELLLQVLEAIRARRPDIFPSLHKGAAYLYISVFSFIVDDFPRGHHYLMAAFAEDEVNHGVASLESSAAKFLLLEADEILNRTGMFHYNLNRMEQALSGFGTRMPNLHLDLDDLRSRFLRRALETPGPNANPNLRTAATALLSFVLEHDNCLRDLTLTGDHPGVGSERPFLHLFKGCVTFETLLRLAPVKRDYTLRGDDIRTLLTSLKKHHPGRFIPTTGHLGKVADSLEQVIEQALFYSPSSTRPEVRAVKTTADLRNKLGHNLGSRPITLEQYEGLYHKVLDSLFWAILVLYE